MTDVIRQPASAQTPIVDFDLHGLVGIRLVNPSSQDLSAVIADIGNMRRPLDRDPDITIRFVEQFQIRGGLRFVKPHEVGFTDGSLLVLDRGSGGRGAAQIPFDQIGQGCEIRCRSGLAAIPLLHPSVTLAMLTKDVVTLHASAFTYNDKGAVVAGWARGGKTSSLLAFMSDGGDFIADDHVYVSPDGNRLYGSQEPVSLRAWHLAELPSYRTNVTRRERSRLRASTVLLRLASRASQGRGPTSARKVASRIADVAEDVHVSIPPDRLFKHRSLAGRLDKAFLAVTHDSREVIVEQVESGWLADRLVFLLQFERRRFLSDYLAFRFAFPDRSNDLIERAGEIERDILHRVLAGTDSYVVYHPFPAPIEALFSAMAPTFT
jgi:hypothetical protein